MAMTKAEKQRMEELEKEVLLARVLEGEGPDRELDAEIALAFGWIERHEKWWPPEIIKRARQRKQSILNYEMYSVARPYRYTASLDAALTLVPEGWYAEIGTRPDWPWARLFRDAPLRVTDIVSGPTPPRALLAACLKARMEAQGD